MSVAGISVSAAPTLTFTATGAVADGVRPGGEAIWFVRSVADFSGGPLLSSVVQVVRDEDGDGKVSLEAEVVPSSVWVVVDFASGDYVIANPDGSLPVRELRERGNGWAAGREHLDFSVSDLHVLMVRPGRGAWETRLGQGGPLDGDGRPDNNLRVSLSNMRRLHGSETTAPVALPRDLVVAIHPSRLWTFVRSAPGGQP